MSVKPKILCVDDEENVLEAMGALLRRRFDVVTATSGQQGLAAFEQDGPFAIVISDMRMPQMDGATFLSLVKQKFPDTVRLLLTGHADVQSAIHVINEGQIFRFLTKPCPPNILDEALVAALEYHRLRNNERVLLEETLHGSVRALLDVLALTHPLAFSRADQIKKYASALVDQLNLPGRWQIEIAAMVSQLGFIVVDNDTLEKFYANQPLSKSERQQFENIYTIPERLLRHIPRLEGVCALLKGLTNPHEPIHDATLDRAWLQQATSTLRLSIDYVQLDASGIIATKALASLRERKDLYSNALLDALGKIVDRPQRQSESKEIPLRSVLPGMVITRDVRMASGALFVPRGFEVTENFVAKVQNLRPGMVKEPILVVIPAST